jgi:Arc/MetJ-type ribon-helix-helix transcriptional regulator
MEVQFTPDQKAFVRQATESGRLHHEDEAVKEALALWEERERRRVEILSLSMELKHQWLVAKAVPSHSIRWMSWQRTLSAADAPD